MTTNVLNLPGDYQLLANNGYVYINAGATPPVTSAIGSRTATISANSGATLKTTGGPAKILAGAEINALQNTGNGVFITGQGKINVFNRDVITVESLGVDQLGKIFLKSGYSINIVSENIWNKGEKIILGGSTQDVDTDLENSQLAITSDDTIDPRAKFINSLLPFESAQYDLGDAAYTWNALNFEKLEQWGDGADNRNIFNNTENVGNPYLRDPDDWLWDGLYDTEEHRRLGSVYFAGGVGIEKDLNVGGHIYGRIEIANTSFAVLVTATNVDQDLHPIFVVNTGQEIVFLDEIGVDPLAPGLRYNPFWGRLSTDRVKVAADDPTTDEETGALIVAGGVGVGESVYVKKDVTAENVLPQGDETGSIGNTTTVWAEAYVNDIYTKLITSKTGPVTIAPEGKATDIIGDIRVRGTNPIGTAPVVTNILYVTMDGSDTNDGRAMDPSRACRTVGGAINSPYYQPGTQIRVAPGHYFEDNPLQLKPYTSIMGSDIRTTSIEPLNKTQDLFHLNSGCYLAFMQFLNGRSGLLEGDYAPGFNRGAYCTAFPPLEGDERIDLFHSPYVQNCTNLSGPWLKDGTMFTPAQTVQIPKAVGTGTWARNTTSIVVNVDNGTIERGMTINVGQTNPGFFDARTLMLANKPFLQEQVVAYVDRTFNSGTFVYNTLTCSRDVGLIVDSIALDMLQDSTSESIFAGLQYWNQSGSAIPGQETTTTAAISYLRDLAVGVVHSSVTATVASLFNTITNIITVGTVGVTDQIVSNGLASTSTSTVNSFDALISNKATFQTQVISWITANHPTFTYTTATCERDVGYIIDSVAFDLLHGGNKQSIKSGVYYYGNNENSTAIPNEIPQTTAAYNFIKSLIPNIVKAEAIVEPYQLAVTQDTSLNPASDYEVATLLNRIDIITNIIRNGPDEVASRIPINITSNETTAVANAWALLVANREFIRAEVIAYLNGFGTFNYSREKCFRDVGILVENVAYDAAFGGNQKAVESGLAYYDGVVSLIAGQESQTTAAIDYLNQLCQQVILNTTCTNLLGNTATYVQVINTVLTGGGVASRSVDDLFNIIVDIINNGPSVAPDLYTSPGPDAAFVSAEVLMQANREFIQQDTINYINNLVQQFPYSEMKCRRDTGLIIDSLAFDLLYPTAENSQSTFAGLQYWNQGTYVGDIAVQLNPTVEAMKYLRDTAVKIIQNITPEDDLVARYQTVITQETNLEPATYLEVEGINRLFNYIIEIVEGNSLGWTDRIVSNGEVSEFASVHNAVDLLRANKTYLAYEITAFVDDTNPGFTYDVAKCRRDVGYLIDSVVFDLLHGGNRQSVQAGLYYYGLDGSEITIQNQEIQTTAAFDYLATIAGSVVRNIPVTAYQSTVEQVFSTSTATIAEVNEIVRIKNTITNIITNGPSVAVESVPIAFTATTSSSALAAFDLLYLNKDFLVEETIAYIDRTYNPTSFNYNEAKCYRDVGLIVDAVSQDILLQGNYKSLEAGLSYWTFGKSYIDGQITTTTMAINHARDIALQIIANQPVTPQTGTIITQIINPFFQYGGDYMPQEAVRRNFNIITTIIENGPLYAPPRYYGGGVFALVGINGADVQIAPQVTSVTTLTSGTYVVGLSTATIGFGTNATLYFGDTTTYPYRDNEVEELSLEFTGNASTWNERKVDPKGGMGGSLVDGAVVSARSPIQSFVYDAFTQLTQGGRGVHIKNDGYAQLVSVFTIFSSIGVEVESGGIASIVNSNANFGDICLQAKGFGSRKFTGTIYNPPFKAYPESPNIPGSDYFNQYYPNGFWPNNAQVMVFLPDLDDRPHISLVMEVEPPDSYLNEQGFPGFLNASPTTGTLITGTITLTGIDNTGIVIGNYVYVRDQFGSQTGTNGLMYVQTGTIVTDLGYQSVTLSKALTSGGEDATNTANSYNNNYFDFYFCGNAYYTVLSSVVGNNPQYNSLNQEIPDGVNILSTASTGGDTSQVPAHIEALQYLNSLTNQVINNVQITSLQSGANSSTQVRNLLVTGGGESQQFIDLRYGEMIDIISAPTVTDAENIIKPSLRTKTGPAVAGAGSAITLIADNIDFLADEVNQYVKNNFTLTAFTYDETICRRDAGYIIDGTYYDVILGTNYNAVVSGIAYQRGIASSQSVLDDEITQTLAAINFIKERSAVSLTSSTVAVSRANAAYDEIIDIINGDGEADADPIVFPSPTGVDANKEKAKNLLVANKEFIKAEIVAWINAQIAGGAGIWSGFTYNSEKCARDVGYLIDALCFDILYDGNWASRICADAYFTNAVSVIPGETAQTVAAYNRLSTVCQQVVINTAVTVSSGNALTQNTSLPPASGTETTRCDTLLQIVEDVINAGSLSGLPALVTPTIAWATAEIQTAAAQLSSDKAGIIDDMIDYINENFVGVINYDEDKCKRDVKITLQRLIYDLQTGGRYNSVMVGLSYWRRYGTHHIVSLGENVTRTDLFPDGATVNFYQRSYISASGYVFEYVGAGTNYGALPQRGVADPVQSREVVQLGSGKVFFTSTDQNGDFRIGPGLVISQATGVLSGRTFTKSLFANMTPFILAIESGGAG